MVSDENQREIQKINKIAGAIEDLSPIFGVFLEKYRSLIGRNFETEGQYFGEPFKPLKPAYRRWKEKKYPGRKILQLERRMITAARGIGSNAYQKITPDSLEFGIRGGESGLPYAKRQQKSRPFFYRSNGTLPIQGLRVLREGLEDYVRRVVEIAKQRGAL